MVDKAKKDLLKTSLLSVLALGVIILSSVAWFANNKQVVSNGMQVESAVHPNLVIAKTAGELKTLVLSDDKFAIDFSLSPTQKLIPSTHDWTIGTATGLKYNDNPRDVSSTSGLKRGGKELTFAAVPKVQNEDAKYYLDYVAYIGSTDAELSCTSLQVTDLELVSPTNSTSAYLKALSVDFYIGTVTKENYKGTLNLAKQDYGNVDATKSVTNVILLGAGNIPLNTSDSPVVVTMRFYFDGGLREIAEGTYVNKTYVRSDQIDLSNISVKVRFEAFAE